MKPPPRPTSCRDCERLRRENQHLSQRAAHLEGLLEEARRSAKRQAAPFSKGEPESSPRRPGRRSGSAYGRKARRPIPAKVDETIDAPLPHACPSCGGDVELKSVADQYQTDVALAADMNKGFGLPYGKVKSIFSSHFGLDVSRGGLCTALHRLARQGQPTYDGLVEAIRSSPVVSPDETGWKVAGHLRWLWAFVTPQATVYAIFDGRGYDEAALILGPDFAGTRVRDGWAPYRKFTDASHQSCLAHLLRRCREMIEAADRGQARFPHALRRILLAALLLRDRHGRGEISDHGLVVAKGRLAARLERLLRWNVTHKPNGALRKHLRNEQPHLLTFLGRANVPATNFQAEQAIRPAVAQSQGLGRQSDLAWRSDPAGAGLHPAHDAATTTRPLSGPRTAASFARAGAPATRHTRKRTSALTRRSAALGCAKQLLLEFRAISGIRAARAVRVRAGKGELEPAL